MRINFLHGCFVISLWCTSHARALPLESRCSAAFQSVTDGPRATSVSFYLRWAASYLAGFGCRFFLLFAFPLLLRLTLSHFSALQIVIWRSHPSDTRPAGRLSSGASKTRRCPQWTLQILPAGSTLSACWMCTRELLARVTARVPRVPRRRGPPRGSRPGVMHSI